MVYFIQHGHHGAIKIGYTREDRSPLERMASLQTGNPIELHLRAVLRGSALAIEDRLHQIFDGQRIRGEWFQGDREMFDLIDAINADEPNIEQRINEMFVNRTSKDVPRRGRPKRRGATLPSKRKLAEIERLRKLGEIQEAVDNGSLVIRQMPADS